MCKNINGSRAIESIIENIKNKSLIILICKEISQNLVDILTTKPGSCVFLNLSNFCSIEDLSYIIENILNNIDKLINDEFGNFIIQTIIAMNNKNYNYKVYEYIKEKFVYLCTQRFSSKVIECYLSNPTTIKTKIIKKLIEEKNIKELILDNYGNYIIQKSLSSYFKDNKEICLTIINTIKNNIDLLKNGDEIRQKIYQKLKKKYKQYFDENSSSNNNNNNK